MHLRKHSYHCYKQKIVYTTWSHNNAHFFLYFEGKIHMNLLIAIIYTNSISHPKYSVKVRTTEPSICHFGIQFNLDELIHFTPQLLFQCLWTITKQDTYWWVCTLTVFALRMISTYVFWCRHATCPECAQAHEKLCLLHWLFQHVSPEQYQWHNSRNT